MNKIYGYGIVDKEGNPWWDECCVCEDREPLDDVCKDLNAVNPYPVCGNDKDSRIPYRVVRLYRVTKK